jgi:Arc/MetJ family transcription regulator
MIICINQGDVCMRTTVTIDDALYEQALQVADPSLDKADIFREAMKTFVRVQAAKRLAALGGSAPQMPSIPRRETESLPQ